MATGKSGKSGRYKPQSDGGHQRPRWHSGKRKLVCTLCRSSDEKPAKIKVEIDDWSRQHAMLEAAHSDEIRKLRDFYEEDIFKMRLSGVE